MEQFQWLLFNYVLVSERILKKAQENAQQNHLPLTLSL